VWGTKGKKLPETARRAILRQLGKARPGEEDGGMLLHSLREFLEGVR